MAHIAVSELHLLNFGTEPIYTDILAVFTDYNEAVAYCEQWNRELQKESPDTELRAIVLTKGLN